MGVGVIVGGDVLELAVLIWLLLLEGVVVVGVVVVDGCKRSRMVPYVPSCW